ncbi:MAG: hypothetical protein IT330_05080 [Anaerolineae bacterium]|nr:hypothetical protein [Anaerolineae bacterium]
MRLVNQFWFADPANDLHAKFAEFAANYPARCELLKIGTSYRGRAIHGLRVGRGHLRLAVIAGLHSQEPLNAPGSAAFIHTLLTHSGLDGEDLSAWVEETLTKQTLYFVPLVNVDGAARFAEDVPNCWIPNRFHTTVWEELSQCINEPMMTFGLKRGAPGFNRLTEEQVREWTEVRGRRLGWLFTDQGVDLWEDWQKFDAPETRALRDFLFQIRPHCVLELHGHERPSRIYVPIPSARGEAARLQMLYGEEMMTQLEESGLPCSRHSVRTYQYKEYFQEFPDFVNLNLGCLSLFGETCCGLMPDRLRESARTDPLNRRDADSRTPTQEEIIRTVWVWLKALVELGNHRSYQ